MKITKIGHCCLLIEVAGKRFLTDPGVFSSGQNSLTNIDAIFITHEHADHFHVESLRQVLKNNPLAEVVTNSSVKKLIDKESINSRVLEGKDQSVVCGVKVCACDERHAEIIDDFGQVQNTGYLLADKLFYPGDSYADPNCEVDILALPVAGPWCKISEAVRYAQKIRPRFAFPVHDGQLIPERVGGNHRVPELILAESGITFVPLKEGESKEFAPK